MKKLVNTAAAVKQLNLEEIYKQQCWASIEVRGVEISRPLGRCRASNFHNVAPYKISAAELIAAACEFDLMSRSLKRLIENKGDMKK